MKNKIGKYIILVVLVSIIIPTIAFAAWWNPFSWGWVNKIFHFQRTEQQQTQVSPLEKACTQSGGKITQVDCYCVNPQEFFNTCLVGACTCTPNPQYKRQLKNCDCGEGKCWDGAKCTDLNSALNQTDETANWKTYTNTQYGFEFKYPSDWNFHTNKTGGYVLTKQHDANWGPSGTTIDFSFMACNLSDKECVDRKKIFDSGADSYSEFQNVDLKIDGVSGRQWVTAAAAFVYAAGIEKNGNFYVFGSNPEEYETRYPNAMSDAKVKAIFDSIIFMTPADETASWKTYTSQKYGFSFKYPLGWSLEVDNSDSINLYKYIYNPNEKQYEGLIALRVFNPNPAITMGDVGGGDRPEIVSSFVIKIDGVSFERKVVTFGVGNLLSYNGIIKSNLGNETDKNNFGIGAHVYSYVKSSSGGGGDFDNILDKIINTFKFESDAVRDSFIKTNLSYLTNYTSNYFIGDDPNSWCFSKKYNNLKDIIMSQYKDSDVRCYCENVNCLNTGKWCVSAKLFDGYYCVDSGGQKIISNNSKVCSGGVCNK